MKEEMKQGSMAKALRLSVREATPKDMEEVMEDEGPIDLEEQLKKVMKLSGDQKNQAIDLMVSILCALKDEK